VTVELAAVDDVVLAALIAVVVADAAPVSAARWPKRPGRSCSTARRWGRSVSLTESRECWRVQPSNVDGVDARARIDVR
jgi:hypothetical protein